MRLVCLGTGGWMFNTSRDTCTYSLMDGDSAILLDAGSGMKKLLEPPFDSLLKPIHKIVVMLTHYHLDHTIGLSFSPAVFADKDVTFYLPPGNVAGLSGKDFMAGYFGSHLFPVVVDALPFKTHFRELPVGEHRIGGMTVRVKRQTHTPFSMAFRFDDMLSYHTDTVYDETHADFSKGVKTILMGMWMLDEEVGNPPNLSFNGHTTVNGVKRIAPAMAPGRLLLIHHHPLYSFEKLKLGEATVRSAYPNAELAMDGSIYDL
ncbi:MAG: MBL fold metallo-hydrolase [bacterium]